MINVKKMIQKTIKKDKEKDSDLVQSAKELLAFVRGDESKCDVSFVFNNEVINVRKIRNNLGMTREEFANTFSFTVRSIQNWERGFRKPNAHTLAYLKLIASNPIEIQKMLVA